MKIEELISGRKDDEVVNLNGTTIPVSALRKLLKEGYVNVKSYPSNKTFSLWGTNCSACFTEEQLRERA